MADGLRAFLLGATGGGPLAARIDDLDDAEVAAMTEAGAAAAGSGAWPGGSPESGGKGAAADDPERAARIAAAAQRIRRPYDELNLV